MKIIFYNCYLFTSSNYYHCHFGGDYKVEIQVQEKR